MSIVQERRICEVETKKCIPKKNIRDKEEGGDINRELRQGRMEKGRLRCPACLQLPVAGCLPCWDSKVSPSDTRHPRLSLKNFWLLMLCMGWHKAGSFEPQ